MKISKKININDQNTNIEIMHGEKPLFSCGFNHYIHSAKIKFEKVLIDFKFKKYIYDIVEEYDLSDEYKIIELLNFYFKKTNKKNFYTYLKYDNLNKYNIKIKENKYDSVIIDYEISDFNNNILEIDSYYIIIDKIKNAMKNKADIICKIYETYTVKYLKLLTSLSKSYKELYICKPLSSKSYNSEKYIICIDFIKEEPIQYINKDLFNEIKEINKKLLNEQYKTINNIIKYITNQNYYGEEYNKYKNIRDKNIKIIKPINNE